MHPLIVRRQSFGFFRIMWRRPEHDEKLFKVLCVSPCRGKFTRLPEPRDFEVMNTSIDAERFHCVDISCQSSFIDKKCQRIPRHFFQVQHDVRCCLPQRPVRHVVLSGARPKVQVIVERMTTVHPRLRSRWLLHQSECSLYGLANPFCLPSARTSEFFIFHLFLASRLLFNLHPTPVIRTFFSTISTRVPPKKTLEVIR